MPISSKFLKKFQYFLVVSPKFYENFKRYLLKSDLYFFKMFLKILFKTCANSFQNSLQFFKFFSKISVIFFKIFYFFSKIFKIFSKISSNFVFSNRKIRLPAANYYRITEAIGWRTSGAYRPIREIGNSKNDLQNRP